MPDPLDDQLEVTGPPIPTSVEVEPVATGIGSKIDQDQDEADD
ncbi:hypothetical protein ACWEV3_34740 [Saccharopolyspora sp. NPDC003752]